MSWRQTPREMGTGTGCGQILSLRGEERGARCHLHVISCRKPSSHLFSVTLNLQLWVLPWPPRLSLLSPRSTCPPGGGHRPSGTHCMLRTCRGPGTQGGKREPQASPSPGPCPPGLLVLLLARCSPCPLCLPSHQPFHGVWLPLRARTAGSSPHRSPARLCSDCRTRSASCLQRVVSQYIFPGMVGFCADVTYCTRVPA